jgi:hypothetical protein
LANIGQDAEEEPGMKVAFKEGEHSKVWDAVGWHNVCVWGLREYSPLRERMCGKGKPGSWAIDLLS